MTTPLPLCAGVFDPSCRGKCPHKWNTGEECFRSHAPVCIHGINCNQRWDYDHNQQYYHPVGVCEDTPCKHTNAQHFISLSHCCQFKGCTKLSLPVAFGYFCKEHYDTIMGFRLWN